MKANRVITPSAPAISDCRQELSRRINPVTASPNAVSKPAKRNRTNARGPCSPGFGRPANAKQVCGVTRLLWARAAVGPAPTERPELGPAVAARPGKSAGFRSTLESGIRSAVIIPMRQQPGPMLIFRLTEDRRSRLDVGRNGGNPHSVPGAPVIPFRRHHEQLKNTCAVAVPTVGAGDLSYPAAAAAVVVVAGRGCRLAGHRLRLGGCRHHSCLLAAASPPGARDRGSGRSTPPCRSRLHQWPWRNGIATVCLR
jgi:hypothetical protein